jgi:hypothetical protein
MRFDFVNFLTSVTGVSSITATSLLVAKKYDLATVVFTALTIGSLGVLWERYSRKSGAPLDLKVFSKKILPEREETEFMVTHAPYVILATISYLLARRKT